MWVYYVYVHARIARNRCFLPARSQVQENGRPIFRRGFALRDKLLNKRVQRNNRAGCIERSRTNGGDRVCFPYPVKNNCNAVDTDNNRPLFLDVA